MGKEICISSTPHETRLAILEDDQLAEIYYERENEYTLAGSIYNGRVTRVLPGMQSAFVDVGLERDAFLYVTDFLELEDSEETDELEKAAVAGGSQPPREVRHQNAQSEECRPARRSRTNRNPGRIGQPRGQRLTVESVPESTEAPAESLAASGQTGSDQEDSSGPGAKRWRGRRRRRGGATHVGSQEGQAESGSSEETLENQYQAPAETEVAPVIHASSSVPAPAPRPGRSPAPPVPFVLPGESLRKYGGTPADDAPKSAPETAAPSRPASTFKPATLIEAPLSWDGSGLLPGESLSKHRSSQTESGVEVESQQNAASPDEIEEEEYFTDRTQSAPESASETAVELTTEELAPEVDEDHLTQEEELVEDDYEETSETAPQANQGTDDPEDYEIKPVIDEPSVEDDLAEPTKRQDESEDQDPDASASHRFDPHSPSGFRLFGFGKKKEEKAATPKSSYAPGSGHIVEEEIEGEEFDAPRIIITAKPTSTTWKIMKRRPCPSICAPATWARCFRRPTSITASR